jgi:5-methylcytosine-specific restriction endonuclease McrA
MKRATPPWVLKSDILRFYKKAARLTEETGIQYEVDHIIPLNHELVCGLNIPENLQIITQEENRKKSNEWNN